MNKQYEIDEGYPCPNLVCFDLIEDGKVTGMYIAPNNDYAKKYMTEFLKGEGYEWVRSNNNGTKKT